MTAHVRRKILSILADERRMTLSELALELACDEDVPGTEIRSLEISLHHNYLPKLADEQYLEYDYRRGDVVLRKRAEGVRNRFGDE